MHCAAITLELSDFRLHLSLLRLCSQVFRVFWDSATHTQYLCNAEHQIQLINGSSSCMDCLIMPPNAIRILRRRRAPRRLVVVCTEKMVQALPISRLRGVVEHCI